MIISNRFYTDVENSIPFSSIWDRNLDRTVQASDSYLRENRIPRTIFEESCNTWRAPIVTSRQEFVWRFFWKVILLESPRGRQKRERETKTWREKGKNLPRIFFDTASPVYLRSSKWFHRGRNFRRIMRNFIRMIDEKNRATIPFLRNKCNSILVEGGDWWRPLFRNESLKATDLVLLNFSSKRAYALLNNQLGFGTNFSADRISISPT